MLQSYAKLSYNKAKPRFVITCAIYISSPFFTVITTGNRFILPLPPPPSCSSLNIHWILAAKMRAREKALYLMVLPSELLSVRPGVKQRYMTSVSVLLRRCMNSSVKMDHRMKVSAQPWRSCSTADMPPSCPVQKSFGRRHLLFAIILQARDENMNISYLRVGVNYSDNPHLQAKLIMLIERE